tara:strand:+ start:364 stop:888 length:525 start_codon:yes stop_codon:yes gene_type:complete
MSEYKEQINTHLNKLYNNILLLSRNKLFYTKFELFDTFQNRIHLIFIHICFIFIKIKHNNKNYIYKNFYQKMFDLIFSNIETNMRELGHGDTTINKNMRSLTKIFYNILISCEKYNDTQNDVKNIFFDKYLKRNNIKNPANNNDIIDYFNKYAAFCFDLGPDSVLKGEIKFNYN